jgi:hypothetical protein
MSFPATRLAALPKPGLGEDLLLECKDCPRYAIIERAQTSGVGEYWHISVIRMDLENADWTRDPVIWRPGEIHQLVRIAMGTLEFRAEIVPANCERAAMLRSAVAEARQGQQSGD